MALEVWLTDTGRHQTDLARELGISRARVSAYARGVLVPKLDVATELDRRSRGLVALKDWRLPADVPTGEAEARPGPSTTGIPEARAKALAAKRRTRRPPAH